MIVWIDLQIVNTYSEFQVNIFSNVKDFAPRQQWQQQWHGYSNTTGFLQKQPSFKFIKMPLTFSQTTPGFYVSAVQIFWKHCWKRRNCSYQAFSPFPTVFWRTSTLLPFPSKLKLSSENFFSLEKFKNLSFGKELTDKYNLNFHQTLLSFNHSKQRLSTVYHTLTAFDAPKKKPFKNIVGKGKMQIIRIFFLFLQCFLSHQK